jgi:hypothetical protein
MLKEIATLDELLTAHAGALGRDFTAYRNHTYRVVNLCAAQQPVGPEQLERLAIAAAFHDLGIWTDGTFDYLPPSVRLAEVHLARTGRAAWTPEMAIRSGWSSRFDVPTGSMSPADSSRSGCRERSCVRSRPRGRAPAFTSGWCSWN